jgi:hypothetical protein
VQPPVERPPIVPVQYVSREDLERARGLNLTRLPGPERVFRIESEEDLRIRIRQDAVRVGRAAPPFPIEPTLQPTLPSPPLPAVAVVEPAYVCHGRLLFEEINSERYGWDLGGIQPLLLTADFYLKILTAPWRRFVDRCRCFDCDLGLCLPGDPVPYVILLVPR